MTRFLLEKHTMVKIQVSTDPNTSFSQTSGNEDEGEQREGTEKSSEHLVVLSLSSQMLQSMLFLLFQPE